MTPSTVLNILRALFLFTATAIAADTPLAPAAGETHPPSRGHGMPQPGVHLATSPTILPMTIPAAFPTPVVQVTIGDSGSYNFVVDTGMSGTVLVRKRVADELNLHQIGHALVGDASGHGTTPVPLVRIDRMAAGDLVLTDVVALAMQPTSAHAASIPEHLDGILGMQLFSELLITLDYPQGNILLRSPTQDLMDLDIALPFDQRRGVMEVELDLGGELLPVIVDSGHRGTLTLPMSCVDRLPLSEPLVPIDDVATVSVRYSRSRSRLAGHFDLGESTFVNPPLVFADEHSPLLIGYGILRYFAITIDQRNQRILFEPQTTRPIDDVVLFEAGIAAR